MLNNEAKTTEEIIEELRKQNLALKHKKNDAEAEWTEYKLECRHLERLNRDYQTDIARLRLDIKKEAQEKNLMSEKYMSLLGEMRMEPAELAVTVAMYKAEYDEFRVDVEAQKKQLNETNRIITEECDNLLSDQRKLELKIEKLERNIREEVNMRRAQERKMDNLRDEKLEVERKIEDAKLQFASATISTVHTAQDLEISKSKTSRLQNEIKHERRKSSVVITAKELAKLDFGEVDEGAADTEAAQIQTADKAAMEHLRRMLQQGPAATSRSQAQSFQQTLEDAPKHPFRDLTLPRLAATTVAADAGPLLSSETHTVG